MSPAATVPEATLPLALTRPRIALAPTRYGILFGIILAAMLAGSANYNNNLGFMLVFILGGMALASLIHAVQNLLGIRVVSVSANPVFAGDRAVFSVCMDPGNRDRSAVSIHCGGDDPALESLSRDSRVYIPIQVQTAKRGWLRPGPLIIESLFPLGLFRVRASIPTDLGCLVYPKPIFGPLVKTGNGSLGDHGGHTTTTPGVDDFQGLAPYQPGHRVRHIAWKALSRGQGIFIKDFMADQGAPVMLDFEAIRSGDTEHRISCLCGMVLRASAMNLEYGIRLPGRTIAPCQGDIHKQSCLKTLALYAITDSRP